MQTTGSGKDECVTCAPFQVNLLVAKKIGHPRPRKRGARPNNGGYTGGSPRPVLKYNTTAAENAVIEALCKG